MKKEGVATALARFFTFHFSLKNKSQRRQPFFIKKKSPCVRRVTGGYNQNITNKQIKKNYHK